MHFMKIVSSIKWKRKKLKINFCGIYEKDRLSRKNNKDK